MAEFGMQATQLPEASGAGANPIGPATAGPLDNGVGGAINNMLSIFAKGMDLVDREKAQAKMNPILAEYSRTMGGIASALETGGVKAKEGLARANSIHRQYLASSPESVAELEKIRNSFFGGTSLNAAQQEEKARIESFQRQKDAARSAGFPIPNDSNDELAQKYIDLHQERTLYNSNYEMTVKKLTEARAQTGFEQSQADRTLQEQSLKFLGQSAGNTLETSEVHLRSLMDAFNKAPDKVGAKNNAIIAWNGWWAGQKAQLTAIAGKNPTLAAQYEQMFRPIEDFGRKMFEEGADVKLIEDELKRTIAATQLQLVQDPGFRTMAAADGLLRNSAAIVLQGTPAVREAVATVLGRMKSGKKEDFIGDKAKEATTFKVLETGIDLSISGKADALTKKDTIEGINSSLSAAAIAVQRSNFSGKDLAGLGDFLSKPSFGKFMSENQLDPNAQADAKAVFKKYYEKTVNDGLDKKLNEVFNAENVRTTITPSATPVRGGGTTTTQTKGSKFTESDFTINMSGSSVVFGMKQMPDNLQDRQFFMEQLKELKPYQDQLNRTIRIAAHLDGRTDYDKYWEENKYEILPNKYPIRPGTIINNMKYSGEGDWRDKRNWEQVKTNE